MKYNLVISRTYVTEIKVVADSIEEAQQWVDENMDIVYEAELEQCNVVNEETDLQEDTPSLNEAEELLDLAQHIGRYLDKYIHVSDYFPSEIHDAVKKLASHAQEMYNED